MRMRRDSRIYPLLLGLAGWLAAWLIRALGRTWRLRITGEDPFASGAPFLAALWHRGFLVAAFTWRDRGVAVPVSRSRDGDRIDAVLRRLGYAESPRGSSSRGATTLLRTMIRRVRAGQTLGMLPDGPRGPAGHAKPGVVALARSTGLPLVPVGVAARPARRLGSWDRALLPLPFSRVHCHYGTPLHVPKRAGEAEIERIRRELEEALHELDARMERSVAAGEPPDRPAAPSRT